MTDASFEDSAASDPAVEVKPTGRKRDDAITAIVLLAFSGYLIIESLSMPIKSEYAPGPGMFPLGLGILLAILSLALLWDGLNPRKQDKASKLQNKRGLMASGLLMLGLVGYALLIRPLGYIITTFLLVLYLMGFVARDNVKTTVLTAAGVTLLLFLIFTVALGVHLPKGP
jgi:putative tricarboxylic transport membrane protein